MNLSFTWINILILFGALNALIFCVILFFQKKHPGSRFLAAFVFVLAYNGFETFNWSSGLDRHYVFFDLFSYIVIYAIGPSLYLYVTSLLYPEQRISPRTMIAHYGLCIFQLVCRIGILIYHFLWINKKIESGISSMDLMNIVWFYAEPLSVVVFLAYLGFTWYEFREFRSKGQIRSISREGQLLVYSWIHSLLMCLSFFAIAWPVTVLIPYLFDVPFDMHYYPIELGLVLFIYWIVLNGYHRMKLIYVKAAAASSNSEPDAAVEKHFEVLKHSMEHDKLYLDPQLNLTKVSLHTGLPAKTISAILNQSRQTSFNDFVNTYRVKEVSQRMIDPAFNHYTISGMAFDSGFNSQATFQRAFKNVMGMSPREYLNLRLKKTA
jgi:AraC-like DNA-binding protein